MTTIIKPGLEAEVEGLGNIYKVNIPFDRALESLREFGIENPISLRDLAYARIKEGVNSSLSKYRSYTREGFLYRKNEPVLLLSNSLLLNLELARQAVEENRKRNYFLTDETVYREHREIAENDKSKEPEKRTVFVLSKREDYVIPTNMFNEDELIRFLFKDQTENYGNFLKDYKINKTFVWLIDGSYVDRQEGTILIQLWSISDERSSLAGDSKDICYDYMVRGVLEKADAKSVEFEKKTL